jgi:hypothetical protein
VHPSAQFRFDGFQLGCHTFADCLPQYRELARLVYGSASVRETQKVKGFRLPFPIPLSIFDGKSPELYQARLFRMQFSPNSRSRSRSCSRNRSATFRCSNPMTR